MDLGKAREEYISSVITLSDDALEKWNEAVFENPTNVGKEDLVAHLVKKYGKTLFVSQSYDINRQWNDHGDILKDMVFVTYAQFAAISHEDIYDFCGPYSLIIYDEAHHAGAAGYAPNILRVIGNDERRYKIFGITTHTKRYSDLAEDVADTIFEGHKIDGITFEDAIRKGILPQFDYISALYSLPKDIDDLIASSSLARQIISDSGLIQVNEEGIKTTVKKHMPQGSRKVVYFVPSIEDSADAEKLAKDLGYGKVHAINYTKDDKANRDALKAYNEADEASLVCISKFNEGAIPRGTNTVVILRKTMTINIFERQVLTALASAEGKPVVYDFVANIDNLIYSRGKNEERARRNYAERVKSLCSQSIVVDYTRQWTSVFNKLRSLNESEWTPVQDELLRKYYPKCGREIYKYIKSHSVKECMLRAEMLGIEYIPPEPVQEESIPTEPYTFQEEEVKALDEARIIPKQELKEFMDAYKQYLDTGKFYYKTAMTIQYCRKYARTDEQVVGLARAFINATTINGGDDAELIEKRQKRFGKYVVDTLYSSTGESSNVVILGGKAVAKEDTKKAMARIDAEKKAAQLEKERADMVLVGDTWMDKKRAIAGLFGETIVEHSLYKTYWRLLAENYKEGTEKQFIKVMDIEEVKRLIENLRSSENPWTSEEEEELLIVKKHPGDTYKHLIRNHCDMDILKKAQESDNKYFADFCRTRTNAFEKNYKLFLQKYQAAVDAVKASDAKRLEQQKREEENRKKKEEQKKRVKNIKPTVVVVSKQKK